MAPTSIERAHLAWRGGSSGGWRVGVTGPDTGPDPVFAALADATRREVLRRVAEGGGRTATQLAGALPVSRQAVVKHLQVLAAAGLVEAERHGREQRYRLTPGPLDEAVAWIAEVGAAWDDRLARLRRHVDPPVG